MHNGGRERERERERARERERERERESCKIAFKSTFLPALSFSLSIPFPYFFLTHETERLHKYDASACHATPNSFSITFSASF